MDISPPENLIERKNKPLPKKWDYETFKEYLLSQPRGKEFLLPLNEFPEEIELSEYWHKAFNAMREKTVKDQIERVAVVGYNLAQRVILLPTEKVVEIPWQWERNAPVAQAAVDLQKVFAIAHGAEGFLGYLHSHPSYDINILNFRLRTGRLSAGDLYNALRGYDGPMIGVAAGGINSLAFKTRESIVPRDGHEKFYDLWEGEPQPRNLDVVIAQKYRLALYKGDSNQVLKRIA
ncbi:hypothetical protein HYV21_00715 [Candidatus Microgenomates bacterium]|nr:hypothetical protein [Candidatus Microgenomates bacterium]